MKDIEEVKENFCNFCYEKERFPTLKQENKQLKQQIEKMENCHNCNKYSKEFNSISSMCFGCKNKSNWELAVVSPSENGR